MLSLAGTNPGRHGRQEVPQHTEAVVLRGTVRREIDAVSDVCSLPSARLTRTERLPTLGGRSSRSAVQSGPTGEGRTQPRSGRRVF